MYHENTSTGTSNNNQIFAGDIYKYYGRLNDSIIFTVLGDYQQECVRVRDINTFKTTYRASTSEISYVPMGICYEAGWMLMKSADGISLTAENMRIQQSISLPHLNNTVLTENEEKITNNQIVKTIRVLKKRLNKYGTDFEVKRHRQNNIKILIKAKKLNDKRVNELILNQKK